MGKIGLAELFRLVVSIAICQAAGLVGSFFTRPAIPTWYATLQKPAFNPPNWVFGPVWTTLFLLMGIALFLVWRKGLQAEGVAVALVVFTIHLVLNVLWSFFFFGMRSPLAGFVAILILSVAICATIFTFGRVSRPASVLLIPYIGWVSFAAFLNFHLWRLNP